MKIACILLFILITSFLFKFHIKKNVGLFNGFLFGLILFYGFIPLLFEFTGRDALISEHNGEFKTGLDFLFVYSSLVLYVIVFVISYNFFNKKFSHKFLISETKFLKNTKILLWIITPLGLLTFFYFFYSLGGISRAFQLAEILRSTNSNPTNYMSYTASLMRIPARLVTLLPFLYLILESYKKNIFSKVLFILTLILSFVFYIFNAGRAPILTFILAIIIPFLLPKFKHIWSYVIILSFAGLPLLDFLDALFLYFTTGFLNISTFDAFAAFEQFAHPIHNALFSLDVVNEFGLRYGKDFIMEFINILPGITFEPSYAALSSFFIGPSWKLYGGIPNDIFTLSIQEFHVLGAFIIPLFFGLLFSIVDVLTVSIKNNRARIVLSTLLAVNIFLFVMNAEMSSVIRSFILIVFPLLLLISRQKAR